MSIIKNFKKLAIAGAVALAPVAAHAAGEPIDLAATGTTLAGYAALGATAALGVFAAKQGIRVLVAGFRMLLGR